MSAIEDSTASLSFFGQDLDVDEITRLLGCAPTSVRRRGSPYSQSHPEVLSRFSAWHLESALPRSETLETQIGSLLDQLPDDLQMWHELTARYDARAFCGIFMEVWNEGFSLTPKLMQRLAERGLRVEFDIYAPIHKEGDE